MSVKRLLLGLFLFFAAIVSVEVGCFFWGYHAFRLGNPWEDGYTVVDGVMVEGLYMKQYHDRQEKYKDSVEKYLWFDTNSFIGELKETEESGIRDSLYVTGLDASGKFDAFCQSGYLAQTPGLIIEKNGQPLAYEDLRPGDIVRTVYLNGDAAQLIAPATYHPIYIEVLN